MKTLKSMRPAAVPLVLSDPFFNVWSFSDCLHDDCTRHWTGERNALTAIIDIDGAKYRFCGKTDVLETARTRKSNPWNRYRFRFRRFPANTYSKKPELR